MRDRLRVDDRSAEQKRGGEAAQNRNQGHGSDRQMAQAASGEEVSRWLSLWMPTQGDARTQGNEQASAELQ